VGRIGSVRASASFCIFRNARNGKQEISVTNLRGVAGENGVTGVGTENSIQSKILRTADRKYNPASPIEWSAGCAAWLHHRISIVARVITRPPIIKFWIRHALAVG